ncbi:MAG: MoaD/ThiS family protein [Betaproteobacteria bacterium]
MKVQLPTPLVDYTGGNRHVTANGATLDAVLRDLERQYTGIRFRMVDEQDNIRPHIRIFVNAELESSLQAALNPADDILIVAALSGG